MSKLVAISSIGKNGQTVVPVAIRKLFKVGPGQNMVGFYVDGKHIEIAPVTVAKTEMEYSEKELDQFSLLAKEKGGRKFKSGTEAKKYLTEKI